MDYQVEFAKRIQDELDCSWDEALRLGYGLRDWGLIEHLRERKLWDDARLIPSLGLAVGECNADLG